MKNNSKNRQIVLLTLFAVILVVVGHSDITNDFKSLWIYKWIYSFHMPLFFFISGFLFSLTMPVTKLNSTSFTTFIKKKTVRLLIPFLFINTIIFLIKTLIIKDSSMMQHPLTFDLKSFFNSMLFEPIGFMWFLPALFSIFVIIFLFYKRVKINVANGGGKYLKMSILWWIVVGIIVVFALELILPKMKFMQFSQAIHFCVFFLLGILYQEYKQDIDVFIRKYWFVIIPIFLIVSVSLMFKGYLAALCGIIFSVSIALILEDKCNDRMVKLSGMSYVVFLLSYFPQMLIRGPIAHLFPEINQYVLSGISFVSGLLIPIALGIVALSLRKRYAFLGRFFLLIGI